MSSVVDSFKDLSKVISMQNEESAIIILRRVEEKLDKLLSQPRVKAKASPKAPIKNMFKVTSAAVIKILEDGEIKHTIQIENALNSLTTLSREMTEQAVQQLLAKMAKQNMIERLSKRKGLYKKLENNNAQN